MASITTLVWCHELHLKAESTKRESTVVLSCGAASLLSLMEDMCEREHCNIVQALGATLRFEGTNVVTLFSSTATLSCYFIYLFSILGLIHHPFGLQPNFLQFSSLPLVSNFLHFHSCNQQRHVGFCLLHHHGKGRSSFLVQWFRTL